jgi:hypothetical protein
VIACETGTGSTRLLSDVVIGFRRKPVERDVSRLVFNPKRRLLVYKPNDPFLMGQRAHMISEESLSGMGRLTVNQSKTAVLPRFWGSSVCQLYARILAGATFGLDS